MSAATDSAAPANFILFQIDNNPVCGIKAISVSAGERVLSGDELTWYFAALDDRPSEIALFIAVLLLPRAGCGPVCGPQSLV